MRKVPKIWKQHAVIGSIHARRANIKISEYLGFNLRIVLRIQKELEESNDDYEGTAD